MSLRAALASTAAAIALFTSSNAWADRVVVLRTRAGSPKSETTLGRDVAEALRALGHVDVQEQAKARSTAQDGTPDTSAEYAAAGKAVTADWTIDVAASETSTTVRVEAVVCQVSTGRTESLARDVHGVNTSAQIQELLGLLLRKQGLGDADVHFLVVAVDGATAGTETPSKSKAIATKLGQQAVYGESANAALGLGVSVLTALVRPDNARGSALSSAIELHGGYAFGAVKNLEARGNLGIAYVGPSSFHLDGGARYAISVKGPVFVGPELTLGMFVPLGGDQKARFLARGAAFVSVFATPYIQIDALAELLAAPGGSGALILGGGSLRGSIRF
jgi:hypothetical protein